MNGSLVSNAQKNSKRDYVFVSLAPTTKLVKHYKFSCGNLAHIKSIKIKKEKVKKMPKPKRKNSCLVPIEVARGGIRLTKPLTREEFAEDMKKLEKKNPQKRSFPNPDNFDEAEFAQKLEGVDFDLPVEELSDDIYLTMLSFERASKMYVEGKKRHEDEINAWQERMLVEVE